MDAQAGERDEGEPGGDGQEERARGAPTADRASRSVGARAEPEENKRARNAAYRSLFAPGTPDRDRNRSLKATVFPDLSHTASPPMCHTQSFCPGCSGNGSNLSYTTLTTLAAPRADPLLDADSRRASKSLQQRLPASLDT